MSGWHSREKMRFFPFSVSHVLPFCPLPAVWLSATTRVNPGREEAETTLPDDSSANISRTNVLVESTVGRLMRDK